MASLGIVNPFIATNEVAGYTSTTTSTGTLTLTSSSNHQQFFTGINDHTVVLPNTSTLVLGQAYEIASESNGIITIQSSALDTIATVGEEQTVIVTCVDVGSSTAASWSFRLVLNNYSGTVPVLDDNATPTYPQTTADGIWYGLNTKAASSSTSILIGNGAVQSIPGYGNNIVIGSGAFANLSSQNVAIGESATASGGNAVAIGTGANCGTEGVAIGVNSAAGLISVAVGREALCFASDSVSIGFQSSVTAGGSCVVGRGAQGNAGNSTVLGTLASCNVATGIALGANASPIGDSNAFGININSSSVNTFKYGMTVNGTPRQTQAYGDVFVEVPTGGLTELTVTSSKTTFFTGTSPQTVGLPFINTLSQGHTFTLINASTSPIDVNRNAQTTSTGIQSVTFSAFTLDVADTTTFPSSGTISVALDDFNVATVTYSGKTPTSFTGATSIDFTGTTPDGGSVTGVYFLYQVGPGTQADFMMRDSTGVLSDFGWYILDGEGATPVLDSFATPTYPETTDNGVWYGRDTKANVSDEGVAIGNGAVATGFEAVASGVNNNASGQRSITFGSESQATGTSSLAVGYRSSAGGNYSIAIGSEGDAATLASQDYAVAIGNNAQASAASAIAFGPTAFANSDNSIAVGAGISVSGDNSIGIGGSTNGSFSTALGPFSAILGENSLAVGTNAAVTADYSIAIGTDSSVSIINSLAIGRSAIANNFQTTALGFFSNASGSGSVSVGSSSSAAGDASIAVGGSSTSSGTNSTAVGSTAVASGDTSSAIGYGSLASGTNAVAMGVQCQATASQSVSIGYGSFATADRAVAMGRSAQSNGAFSVAIGVQSLVDSETCVALGYLANVPTACDNSTVIGFGSSTSVPVGTCIGFNAVVSSTDRSLGLGVNDASVFTNGVGATLNITDRQIEMYPTMFERFDVATGTPRNLGFNTAAKMQEYYGTLGTGLQVILPLAVDLSVGHYFELFNESTVVITIDSELGTVCTLAAPTGGTNGEAVRIWLSDKTAVTPNTMWKYRKYSTTL